MGYTLDMARLQRMQEIHREIAELRQQIRKVEILITQYEKCGERIKRELDHWDEQKPRYDTIWLAPVKRENYFEGYSTDQIEIKLLDTIEKMAAAVRKIRGMPSGIDGQIKELEELIEKLEQQIKALEEELGELREEA